MTVDIAPAPLRQPSVVLWLKIYVVLNALMYLAVAGLLAAVAILAPDFLAEELGPAVILLAIASFCVLLALVYLVALAFPLRPWAWVYDLVLICLGFTGCLTLPFSIALLIFWIKPEAKNWFEMR
ncbi:MAG: hypothetical protein ACSLFQ_22705 [Thermoanaerobaculia bacterium]